MSSCLVGGRGKGAGVFDVESEVLNTRDLLSF